jgi:hypothetical protein
MRFFESANLNLANNKNAPKIFLFVTEDFKSIEPVLLAKMTLFLLRSKGFGPFGV